MATSITQLQYEQKLKRASSAVKYVLAAAAAFAIAPYIYTVIGGMIGAGIAFFVATALAASAKPVGLLIAQWALKAKKAAVRANPIETRQLILKQRTEALETKTAALKVADANIRIMGEQVQKLRDPVMRQQGIDRYNQLVKRLAEKSTELANEREKLANDKQDLEVATTIYNSSKNINAADALMQAGITGLDGSEVDMMNAEASRAMDEEFFTAMSGLGSDLGLEFKPSATIDVPSVIINKERIER